MSCYPTNQIDVMDYWKYAEHGARRVRMLFRFMIEYVILERNVESLMLLDHWVVNGLSTDIRSIVVRTWPA
jgi:hypothetical protein